MSKTKWRIEWTPVEGDLASRWAIYFRDNRSGPEWTRLGESTTTSFEVDLQYSAVESAIAVAPIVAGVESPREFWFEVPIVPASPLDLDPPDAPTALHGGQDLDRINLRWTPGPLRNVDHYEVRQGGTQDWPTAIKVLEVPGTQDHASFGWWAAGAVEIGLAAVSLDGRYSSPVWISLQILADSYYAQQGEVDEVATGFLGTKTDSVVSGSDLVLSTIPAGNACSTAGNAATWPGCHIGYYPEGSYITAPVDVGALVQEKIEVAIGAGEANNGGVPGGDEWFYPPFESEDGNSGVNGPGKRSEGWNFLPSGQDLRGNRIEIYLRRDLGLGGGWLAWEQWVPGCIYRYRLVQLKIIMRSLGFFSPKITTFKWRRKRRNWKMEGTAVSNLAPGGLAVSFTNPPFTAVPVVVATPGAANITIEVFNVSAIDFYVRQYNPVTGALVAEPFSWHALGV